jgi:[ribosomal protein S5]-alanine N-acetyltransferase
MAMVQTVSLRAPQAEDLPEFVALARQSRVLHQPWVSAPTTPLQYQNYLAQMAQTGQCARLVCSSQSKQIVGVINISNIVLGKFCSAYVGYYMFAGFERQGYMRAGLLAASRYAFKTLKLNRLEANIQPANLASIALVQVCGFTKEGYSPRYLKIGDQWQDHERWALLA